MVDKLHYEQVGDNYKLKDPFKILALKCAATTAKNLKRFSKYGITIKEADNSRGDSAYRILINSKKSITWQLALVEESIGTKNIIADELEKRWGKNYYFNVAVDNIASIVNDLSTTGASPLSFMFHIAAFPNEWFLEKKVEALLKGTAHACNLAGMAWGGGESGTDRDIIMPNKCLLSGSATGLIIPAKKVLEEDKIKVGDAIIVMESSGVHTNGITLLRRDLLDKLPLGYDTLLSDGRKYGEALMDPSIIYAPLVEVAVHETEVHYAVHITGHGWRKLMRAKKSFVYNIDRLPEAQPIFKLIQKYANLTDRDMYDTYNMGGGFALFVPIKSVDKILKLGDKYKIKGMVVGKVSKGKRSVVIKPLGLRFDGSELKIR